MVHRQELRDRIDKISLLESVAKLEWEITHEESKRQEALKLAHEHDELLIKLLSGDFED